MVLRVDLKLQLQRVAKKLYVMASKERSSGLPVRRKGRRFALLAISGRSGRVDQRCRLLRLPVELLLQILEYLQTATPVQPSDYPHPLVSFRLYVTGTIICYLLSY